ncbi:MAG: macro domain-containing protein [Treponema sp.]|nr:macro domain-containing protein [Treponema sp.]
MISFKEGDIFDSPAQCLVNTVNCEGFMGKGIAYQFKEKFPENNRNYVFACKTKSLTVGNVLFFSEKGKIIANFPTKDKWREKSQYSYIKEGLENLARGIESRNIASIAIPPLGCGNGGLDWNIVKKMITSQFQDLSVDVTIFEPSKQFTPKNNKIPKMTASHLVLMKLKGGIPSSQFNKLRLQKAAYFLNVFSNTNYFKFEEYKFGPYAHSIEILSQQIKEFQESYHVNTVGAEAILYNNLISAKVKETVEKYKVAILKSTNFVNSIASNHELEMVATIVAIIRTQPQCSDEEIVFYFLHNWPKYDKNRFYEEEILASIGRLVRANIIRKEIFGYTVSEEIFKNPKLMPKYEM